jgi:hypothetical protein
MFAMILHDSQLSSCSQHVSPAAADCLRKSRPFVSRLPSPPRYAEKLFAATSSWNSIDKNHVFKIIARPRRDVSRLQRQIANHSAVARDSQCELGPVSKGRTDVYQEILNSGKCFEY